jgi:hypothetical protein
MDLDEAVNLCRIKQITTTQEGYEVWLMSDILVKALLPLVVKDTFANFSNSGINIVEGANFLSDPRLIPDPQIWVLDYIAPEYWKYIICHEVTEVNLRISKGMSYSEAHEEANKAEWKLRIEDVIKTLKKAA